MSLSFTTAPTFVKGAIITSAEHIQLAAAFNDRLRSGVGDGTQRIHQLTASAFRQIRNPSCEVLEACQWPTLLEFQEFYAHVDPDKTNTTWPDADAGEEEGANLACPTPAFVFGNPFVEDEGSRLTHLPIDGGAGTPAELWALGKAQRGAYDPTTGNIGSPSFTAARSHLLITQAPGIFHNKAFGGYFAEPKVVDPSTSGFNLQRSDSDCLNRILLNAFIKDFRGSRAQREGEDYTIEAVAWLNEEFLSRQYLLAPNKGHTSGSEVVEDYHTFDFSGSSNVPRGTQTISTTYSSGFVLGGLMLSATGLVGETIVEVLNGSMVIDTIALTAGEDGTASALRSYTDGMTPVLSFRLAADANFTDSSGRIDIESSELLAYKPQHFDAALILRCATAKVSGFVGGDTRGLDWDLSREVFDDYSTNGCITNRNGATGVDQGMTEINTNPVFDAARRLARDWTRVVNRLQFVGYEVSDGKSVLYFKRYCRGLKNQRIDSFINLAPSPEVIVNGELKEGQVYIVRSGSIIYEDVDYHEGDIFTATSEPAYESDDDAQVYEYEGIHHDALPLQESNEWLMHIETKVYQDSTTGILKTDAFGDYFAFNAREHFYDLQINKGNDSDLLVYGTQGPPYPDFLFNGEFPKGYAYAGRSNRNVESSAEEKANFYKSCRIYEPPVEIDSATVLIEGGEEIVKLVMTGRMQHCDEAPSTIGRDSVDWDRAALNDEPYRTDENALRQYLIWQTLGFNAPHKTGDASLGSPVWTTFDNVFGSVIPHFFFTKLVTKPFEDTPPNATIDKDRDTLISMDRFQQMEFYLRAMCEGYIDDEISSASSCSNNLPLLFDYTYQRLCQKAFGRDRIDILDPATRSDSQGGFGPLPAVFIYAAVLNEISSAVNLLIRARVMLPFKLQCRISQYGDTNGVTPDWPAATVCNSGTQMPVLLGYSPPSATTLESTAVEWEDCDSFAGSASADFTNTCPYSVRTRRQTADYRFQLIDPAALEAMPPDLRDLFQTRGVGFSGIQETISGFYSAATVATEAESEPCNFAFQDTDPFFWDGASGYKFTIHQTIERSCSLFTSGTVNPGAPPSGDFGFARNTPTGGAECFFGSSKSTAIRVADDNSTGFIEVPLS